MGVYIKGLKKPKGCYECPIAKSYLDCLMEKKYICPIGHTDDCPLIEIEDTEYEWCHECKEYDQERHCCHRWSMVIRKTAAELEEHYGKYITKHDKTLVIDYPDTDEIQTILLMDDEGFTRVFEERRSDDKTEESRP